MQSFTENAATLLLLDIGYVPLFSLLVPLSNARFKSCGGAERFLCTWHVSPLRADRCAEAGAQTLWKSLRAEGAKPLQGMRAGFRSL